MTVTLRPGTANDVKAMYQLDRICFAPPFRFSLQAMARFALQSNASSVLCEASGQLAGFIIWHLEDDVCYVVTLDVAPGMRRQGIAQRLMRSAECHAATLGATCMALHVSVDNQAAVRLYDRLNFTPISRERAFYGPSLDALLYRKRI